MAEYFVRTDNGSDDNNGTDYGSAFKTIAKAASVVVDDDTIKIFSGLYSESVIDGLGAAGVTIIGHGKVIIDAAGGNCIFYNFGQELTMTGLEMLNAYEHWIDCAADHRGFIMLNCTLANIGAHYQVGPTVSFNGSRYTDSHLHNCKLYGLNNISAESFGTMRFSSCLIDKCVTVPTTSFYSCAGDHINVINTAGCHDSTADGQEPPYMDVSDPMNPDLKFDTDNVEKDFIFYRDNGMHGGMIGCIETDMVGWINGTNAEWTGLCFDSTEPSSPGAWANYEAYYNTSWVDVQITAGSNNEICFEAVDGVEIIAVLAEDLYTSGAQLATEIQDKLNSADTGPFSYTASFGSNKRIELESDGDWFNLLISTGTSGNSAYPSIGFTGTSDRTGTTLYSSDEAIVVGPSVWAEAGSVPASVTLAHTIELDLSFSLNPKCCHAVSPVIPTYVPKVFKGLDCSFTSAGDGGVDSTGGTGTRTARVRASNTPFGMHDDKETTQLDWIDVELGMVDPLITRPYKYWQYCLVLRTNAV